MLSRRNIIKLITILAIILIGVAYWHYAEKRSSPLEEVEKIVSPPLVVTMNDDLVATALEVPAAMQKGVFAKPRTVNLPAGWHAKLFATGLGQARFMAFGPVGSVYVTSKDRGQVIALLDEDGDFVADTVTVRAKDLANPNGIVSTAKGLVVAATDAAYRLFDQGTGTEKLFSFPDKGSHYTRTILPDFASGYIVSVGSTCNSCKDDPLHAAILGYSPNEYGVITTPWVIASGLRNSVGMTFRPGASELWATDNGRDFLGDNLPPDEVNVIETDKDYGWPYCYGDKIVDPAFKDAEQCKDTVPPKIEIPAHSAPLGLRFYEKKGESATERGLDGQLLVAYHGSWNHTIPTGYKVVRAKEVDGKWELHDFMTGFIEGSAVLGRPVDVIEGLKGELYVSDDKSGSIYVLTHD